MIGILGFLILITVVILVVLGNVLYIAGMFLCAIVMMAVDFVVKTWNTVKG